MRIEYVPDLDSYGNYINYDCEYFAMKDGQFVPAFDINFIFRYLIWETEPTKLTTMDDILNQLRKQCECGATGIFDSKLCNSIFEEVSVDELIEKYRLRDQKLDDHGQMMLIKELLKYWSGEDELI
jgi:hypothetical protein